MRSDDGVCGSERRRRGCGALLQLAAAQEGSGAGAWPADDGRPLTATLERPRVLDIAFLGKIDMSLTRKGFICISSLCSSAQPQPQLMFPRAGELRRLRGLRGGRGSRQRQRNNNVLGADSNNNSPRGAKSKSDSNRNNNSPRGADSRNNSVSTRTNRSNTSSPSGENNYCISSDANRSNNNSPSGANSTSSVASRSNKKNPSGADSNNNSRRSCARPVQLRRGRPAPGADLRPPPLPQPQPQPLPQPCTACGRPEHPERFHSHPATSLSARRLPPPPPQQQQPASPPAAKSSVRKPVAIKFRSGRGRQREQAPAQAASPAPAPAPEPEPARPKAGPRTVLCYLCGREFGTASYPLHEPHCLQRWQRESGPRPPPARPPDPPGSEGWNRLAWEAAQTRLLPCASCGRTFAPDRLPTHQRSCRGPAPEGSAAESGGTACCVCGRVLGSAALRRHQPRCQEQWRADRRRPEDRSGSAAAASASAPGTASAPAPATGPRPRAVLCYLCGRMFGTASINIHEGQCLRRWRAENDRLPPQQRRPEPEKPCIVYTKSGVVDYQGTMNAIWQTHLEQLVPCGRCGRTFYPDRLEVHQRACKGGRR